MLFWSLVVLSLVLWAGMIVAYFRAELFVWFDNRFGPDHVAPKPPKPRRRMYD